MTKCANFNLPQYPKLDAYLKDKLGDGSIDYTTAISFIDDDLFINMIDTNKINIEQQVNKAYESLIKAVAIRTNNPALLSKINDDSTNYNYLTDKAKKDAIKFVRGQLNHFIFQNKLVNRKERINDLLNHLIVYFTGNKNNPGLIPYILDTITKNNPQAKEEFDKYLLSKHKELLDSSLSLVTNSNQKEGFVIQPIDGSYKITFSEKVFEEFFNAYIKDYSKKLLFS